MKKVLTLIALAGLLAVQASALTVNVTRTDGYFTIPGGEFTIATVSPDAAFDAIYKNYASVATLNGGFQTFCLQFNTSTQPNPQTGILDAREVTVGTGYLYSMFARGTLAGYNYTPGPGRAASAYALQNAIWALQGTVLPSSAQAAAAGYLAMAVTQFGSLSAAQAVGGGTYGPYGVDALRLSYQVAGDGSVTAQPMLALVPDGGATLMLLGLALSGIAAVARKARA